MSWSCLKKHRFRSAIGALVSVFALTPAVADERLERFAARAENSAAVPDYTPFDKYLDVFGFASGKRLKFNFTASREEGTDFLRLYTKFLTSASPTALAGDDQLAYWLNLRNVLVLAHLSGKGGRADMKTDRGAAATPGPAWTAKAVTVDGIALSIDDIERGIILANWKDPRVLYGLYQGSAGGPSAGRKAFRGPTVWADLEAAATTFLQTPAGFQLTKRGAEVSAVFDWHSAALFGGDEAALRAHLEKRIPEGARQKFAAAPAIVYKTFNYKLDNFTPRTAEPQIESRQPTTFGTGS